MKKPIEPFWWSLFGAGGVISAMFIPVLLFLNGLAIPLGWVPVPSYEALTSLVQLFATRAFLFAVVALSMFHWAHRFRFTLYDGLQLKHLNTLIAVICYGGASVGTGAAVYVFFIG